MRNEEASIMEMQVMRKMIVKTGTQTDGMLYSISALFLETFILQKGNEDLQNKEAARNKTDMHEAGRTNDR